MSQWVETNCKAFEAGAAIAAFLRVTLSSGRLAAAGVNDLGIGTIEEASFAATAPYDVRSVRLWSANGTRKMVAAGAIAAGAKVYAAAGGKISATRSAVCLGIALETATANNDVIEVLIVVSREPENVIEHHTAADTLTKEEAGSVHTNLGAAGAILITLPQDAVAGDQFHFNVMTAQELRIDPGAAGAVYINGAKQTDDKYISADDEGEHVTLTADGNGDWIAGPTNGTWSVEA